MAVKPLTNINKLLSLHIDLKIYDVSLKSIKVHNLISIDKKVLS